MLVDQLGDLRFEIADLSLQELEDFGNADQRLLRRELLLSIGFGRAEVNELPAAFHQLFELGLRPDGNDQTGWLDGLSELRGLGKLWLSAIHVGTHSSAAGR